MLPPLKKRQKRPRYDPCLRSKEHLAWVRQHGCVVKGCQNQFDRIDPCHVKTGAPIAIGRKVDDSRTVSMCRSHHREQHNIGERAFMEKYGLDLVALAEEFASLSPALKKLRLQSA
jgi:hypothetical protein